jgi:hypothetical protein
MVRAYLRGVRRRLASRREGSRAVRHDDRRQSGCSATGAQPVAMLAVIPAEGGTARICQAGRRDADAPCCPETARFNLKHRVRVQWVP